MFNQGVIYGWNLYFNFSELSSVYKFINWLKYFNTYCCVFVFLVWSQYTHNVVLTSIRRRFNVMDVEWMSKRRRVLTGILFIVRCQSSIEESYKMLYIWFMISKDPNKILGGISTVGRLDRLFFFLILPLDICLLTDWNIFILSFTFWLFTGIGTEHQRTVNIITDVCNLWNLIAEWTVITCNRWRYEEDVQQYCGKRKENKKLLIM